MSRLSGPQRRYLGAAVASFAVGVGYLLMGSSMTSPCTPDPYAPPVTACLVSGLENLGILALLGLIFMSLALGGIYYWLRQAPGVQRGRGCASILLGLLALVLVLVVAAVVANP